MAKIATEVYVNGRWVREDAYTLGRRGGKVKSEIKSIAARENGKKGGRPNKQLDIEDI